MATSTTTNYRFQQEEEPNPQFLNKAQCFAIDGPGSNLTSALQVVTEALSSSDNRSQNGSSSSILPSSLSRVHSFSNNLPAQTLTSLKLNTSELPSKLEKDEQNLQGCTNIMLTHQPTFTSEPTSAYSSDQQPHVASNSSNSFPQYSSDLTRTTNGNEIIHTEASVHSATGKTVVAADSDVSNGFVKDGKMLPYVFEANDSGVRKRTSKILPVCGVCGKRFVCVTTMKRHLVTHTGEKPFSCKVCGKQYTQKGNLRVHERTHRNDRPFECNICHQKFYRKEPMQKHQWRQHGIVHFKSRPNHTSQSPSRSIEQGAIPQSNLEGNTQANGSYASNPGTTVIVKRENPPLDHTATAMSSKYDVLPENNIPQINRSQSTFAINYPPPPEAHRSSSSNGRDRSLSPIYKHHRESLPREQYKDVKHDLTYSLPLQPPQAHSNNGKRSDLIENSNTIENESLDGCVNLSSHTSFPSNESSSANVPKHSTVVTLSSVQTNVNGEFEHAKSSNLNRDIGGKPFNNLYANSHLQNQQKVSNGCRPESINYLPSVVSSNLKHLEATNSLKFNETISLTSSNPALNLVDNSSSANTGTIVSPTSSGESIVIADNHAAHETHTVQNNLANSSNKDNVVILIPSMNKGEQTLHIADKEDTYGNKEEYEELNKNQYSKGSDYLQHAPLKLKMKFAQAYQREVQEQIEKEKKRDEEDSRQLGGSCGGVQQIIIKGLDKMELEDAQSSITAPLTKEVKYTINSLTKDQLPESQQQAKEMVECQCKSCGSTFEVHDPYNFRCDNCHMKYTSMPTHLIADPLQCIGCCQVFPHKPALKAHQMSPQITNSDGTMASSATTMDSKERPFRCCKCGYGFRQKAHLQKHQWRIHRRRIEPMDQQPIKEAEAFFHAIKSSKALSVKPSVSEQGITTSTDPDITTVTIQDIINHGVEHSVRSTRPFPFKNTTSSRYFSDILGLEFDGNNSNNSSNQGDMDNECTEENENMEYVEKYRMDDIHNNVTMKDSSNEGNVSRRQSLDKEKCAEVSQPLDLSPMKKGNALDYSFNSQQLINNQNLSISINSSNNNNVEIDNVATDANGAANNTIICQSSTTYNPPKINLRLRDFATSNNLPTKNESGSIELTLVSRSRTTTADQIMPNLSPNQAKPREDNPLLNQRPLPIMQHNSLANTIQLPIVQSNNMSALSMAPAWKKARTSSPSGQEHNGHTSLVYAKNQVPVSLTHSTHPAVSLNNKGSSNMSTHRTLPPISNLQKPMSLVRKLLPTATSCSISNSPIASVTGPKLSITPALRNDKLKSSSNQLLENQNEEKKNGNIAISLVNPNPSNQTNIPHPNIVTKPGNSDFLRDKLLQLTSQNVRTV